MTDTLWRAQILPEGSQWDHLVQPIMQAHAALALDVVPFLLSDWHTSDPSLTTGYVQGFRAVPGDGLDVLLVVHTDYAAEVLRTDRELRAAPQIITDWIVPDGREFKAVVRHVLAAHKSRLTGLRGFEELGDPA